MREVLHVPFPWFRRDAYSRARCVMEDGVLLPVSFDKWLSDTEAALNALSVNRFQFHRVVIDVDGFLIWCRSNGLPPDGIARMKYALTVYRQREAGRGPPTELHLE